MFASEAAAEANEEVEVAVDLSLERRRRLSDRSRASVAGPLSW